MSLRLPRAGLAVVWIVGALACGQGTMPTDALGVFADDDGGFSTVRYFDRGLVSLNEVCPLTRDRLNLAIEPVYVNGRPIGFC